MSLQQETFDDAELNNIAMEIIHDLSADPQLDPNNDAFICELAEEIEVEILNLYYQHQGSDNPASETSTDPSLYLPLSSTTSSSTRVIDNLISPTIISRSELSANDSLNQCFPPIPSSKPSKSFPHKFGGNKKRAVASYTKRNKAISYSTFSSKSPRYSPFNPPVSINLSYRSSGAQSPISITSDISSCMSPRDQTPKSRVSIIPDFSDCVAKKKKKKKVKKKMTVIAPIVIDTNISRKTDKTYSMTPTYVKVRKQKVLKVRANSNVFTQHEIDRYNEYAVEGDDGVLVFKPYNFRSEGH